MAARNVQWIAALIACLAVSGCGPDGSQTGTGKRTSRIHTTAGTRVAFEGDYANAFRLAQRDAKPMMVFFTASWCGFCHEMEREAFRAPDVAAVAQRFVCVRVDADRSAELCRRFGIEGYPTVQFISPLGVQLNRYVGKLSATQLRGAMQAALSSVSRQAEDRRPLFWR